ncbi:MAG: hypothetical protein IIZ68_04100, partial [Clostridia bacterium]|nr:hypothetical protein [Clostridia bacterium]
MARWEKNAAGYGLAVWDVLSCPDGEKCISRVRAFALLPASGAYTAYAARALHPMGSATVVLLPLDLRVLRRAVDA